MGSLALQAATSYPDYPAPSPQWTLFGHLGEREDVTPYSSADEDAASSSGSPHADGAQQQQELQGEQGGAPHTAPQQGRAPGRAVSLEFGHELPSTRAEGDVVLPRTAPPTARRQFAAALGGMGGGGGGGGAPAPAESSDHTSLSSPRSWQEPSEYVDTPATPSTGGTFSFQPSMPATGRNTSGTVVHHPAATPGFPAFPSAAPGGGEGGVGEPGGGRRDLAIDLPPGPAQPGELDGMPTFVRQSVARRLSQKADQRRQSAAAATPPTAGMAAEGPSAAAGTPRGAGVSGGAGQQHGPQYAPVIDTMHVPELERFCSGDDEGVPTAVIVALSTPHRPPTDECSYFK